MVVIGQPVGGELFTRARLGGTALAAILVLVSGSLFTSVQAGSHDHSTHNHSHLTLPAVAGLERARPGSHCADAGYVVDIRGPGRFCSHGPDPAPAGVDLGDYVATREITASESTVAAATVPCDGDGTSGQRVETIYARASTSPDRYSSVVDALRTSASEDLEDIVSNTSGGARSVRFVTEPAAVGECQVVVRNAVLSPTGDDFFNGMVDELRAQGFNRHDRKYLVWLDVPAGGTDGPEICGIGAMSLDEAAGTWNANNGRPDMPGGQMARIDTPCWGSVLPSTETPVEAHELFHTLGAVQPNAPNSTSDPANPEFSGLHCTDNYDVMCYDDDGDDDEVFGDLNDGTAWGNPMTIDCTDPTAERLLDCSNDDYFSLSPAPGTYLADNWNTATSSFLIGGRDLCTRTGTPANDVITGTTGIDVFCGLGGDDVIKARNKDIVFGGPGSDTLDMSLYTTPINALMEFGNAGVVDQSGNFINPVAFHTDVENVRGTTKDDFIAGNNLSNKLFGGGGKDSIIGKGGNDELIGEGGDDQMQVDAGNDKFVGGAGFDFIAMQMAIHGMTVDLTAGTASGMGADKLSGMESMFGSSYADILKGNGVFNFMMGGAGGDVMYGRGGADHMYGESGNDKLYGDGGYDYLRGDTGRDVCKVGPGGGSMTGCP